MTILLPSNKIQMSSISDKLRESVLTVAGGNLKVEIDPDTGLSVVTRGTEIATPDSDQIQQYSRQDEESDKFQPLPPNVGNALLTGDFVQAVKRQLAIEEFADNTCVLTLFQEVYNIITSANEQLKQEDAPAILRVHEAKELGNFLIAGWQYFKTKEFEATVASTSMETIEQLAIVISKLLVSNREYSDKNAAILLRSFLLIIQEKQQQTGDFYLKNSAGITSQFIKAFSYQPKLIQNGHNRKLLFDILAYLEFNVADADRFLTALFNLDIPLTNPVIARYAYEVEQNPNASFSKLQAEQRRLFYEHYSVAQKQGNLREFVGISGIGNAIANRIVFLFPPVSDPPPGPIGFEIESSGHKDTDLTSLPPRTSITFEGMDPKEKSFFETKPEFEFAKNSPFRFAIDLAIWYYRTPLVKPASLHIHFDRDSYPNTASIIENIGALLGLKNGRGKNTYEVRQWPRPFADLRTLLNRMMLVPWLSNFPVEYIRNHDLRTLIGLILHVPTTAEFFIRNHQGYVNPSNTSPYLEELKISRILLEELVNEYPDFLVSLTLNYWNSSFMHELLKFKAVALLIINNPRVIEQFAREPKNPLISHLAVIISKLDELQIDESIQDEIIKLMLKYPGTRIVEFGKVEIILNRMLNTYSYEKIIEFVKLISKRCYFDIASHLVRQKNFVSLIIQDPEHFNTFIDDPDNPLIYQLVLALNELQIQIDESVQDEIIKLMLEYPGTRIVKFGLLDMIQKRMLSTCSYEELIKFVKANSFSETADHLIRQEKLALLIIQDPEHFNTFIDVNDLYNPLIWELISALEELRVQIDESVQDKIIELIFEHPETDIVYFAQLDSIFERLLEKYSLAERLAQAPNSPQLISTIRGKLNTRAPRVLTQAVIQSLIDDPNSQLGDLILGTCKSCFEILIESSIVIQHVIDHVDSKFSRRLLMNGHITKILEKVKEEIGNTTRFQVWLLKLLLYHNLPRFTVD